MTRRKMDLKRKTWNVEKEWYTLPMLEQDIFTAYVRTVTLFTTVDLGYSKVYERNFLFSQKVRISLEKNSA